MKKFLKPSLNFTLFFIVFLISLVSYSQVTPANCTQGCTSNDVQIQRAYLSNQAGTILPNNFVCPGSGTASVYLTLELTTKTPRVGVAIFTRIKNFTPPSTIGSEVSGSPISQCFGITLNQPTNKVTFQTPFNWTCGTAIVMTDIFIGWGTGNSNFCPGPVGTSGPFICPATPSKCFALPPGSFVAIETPTSQNGSATLCSADPGGTTATFNLNNINVTSSNNVTITWWENYTAPSTFANQIASPASYTTGTKTVYAKITSNSDASVFSVSTVTLTVNQTPNLVINNPAALCSPNTADLTAAAVTQGSTIPANTTLSYWANSDGTGAVPNPAAVGAGTYYIKATCNTSPECSDIKPVTVTVNQTPANPTANVTQPTCANANGTVTVTSPLDGGGVDYEYNNNGGAYQDGLSFTVAAGGAYSIRARNKNGLCVSTGGASGTMGAQPQTPAKPTLCIVQPTLCGPATGSITVLSPTGDGYEYSKDGGTTWQPGTVFSNLAAGSNPSIIAKKDGCTSAAASCSEGTTCAPPSQRTNTVTQTETTARVLGSATLESSSVTVSAIPNPFSNQVRFVITNPEAGSGTLDIYNMAGQKIKTVYQGNIPAGVSYFDLTLATKQVANHVYVLRIGDKKMTGKIVQINQ